MAAKKRRPPRRKQPRGPGGTEATRRRQQASKRRRKKQGVKKPTAAQLRRQLERERKRFAAELRARDVELQRLRDREARAVGANVLFQDSRGRWRSEGGRFHREPRTQREAMVALHTSQQRALEAAGGLAPSMFPEQIIELLTDLLGVSHRSLYSAFMGSPDDDALGALAISRSQAA